jgi:hypothetical protein
MSNSPLHPLLPVTYSNGGWSHSNQSKITNTKAESSKLEAKSLESFPKIEQKATSEGGLTKPPGSLKLIADGRSPADSERAGSMYRVRTGDDDAMWEFETKLVRSESGEAWTFASLPLDMLKDVQNRAQLRIKGTIDGASFHGTLLPAGKDSSFVMVNKELREKIGKKDGDVVSVRMDIEREPTSAFGIPLDLAVELMKNAKAKACFDHISPSHKQAYLNWIGSAKLPETRKRRIVKAIKMLSDDTAA